MQHVIEHLISPMINIGFKVPVKDEHLDNYMLEVAEDLQRFDTATLKQTYQHFRRNRVYRTFPSIKEMIDTCADLQRSKKGGHKNPIKGLAWTENEEKMERCRKAHSVKRKISADQSLLECPFAKDAANEGWILWLWDHYRYHDRRPTQHEITDMMFSYQERKKVEKECPLGVLWWKDGFEERKEREKVLIDLVMHGVMPDRK